MAPKYLTGDKAGIEEFLSRFDVWQIPCTPLSCSHALQRSGAMSLTDACRSSSSIAMVRRNSALGLLDPSGMLDAQMNGID